MMPANAKVEKALDTVLVLLRNGATVSGTDGLFTEFKQKCLDRAFYEACTELVPLLVESGLVNSTERLENVCDIGVLLQKRAIG
jgi:hypothetical protein